MTLRKSPAADPTELVTSMSCACNAAYRAATADLTAGVPSAGAPAVVSFPSAASFAGLLFWSASVAVPIFRSASADVFTSAFAPPFRAPFHAGVFRLCAPTCGLSASTRNAAISRLSKLRIDFVKVTLVHQYFPWFAAHTGRYQAVHLHHVDEPRGAAEADAQAALQIGNRGLAARHDNSSRFVVQIVLLHLHRVELLLFGRN